MNTTEYKLPMLLKTRRAQHLIFQHLDALQYAYLLLYILCIYHRSLHVNSTIRHSKLRYIFTNLLRTENETKSLKTIHD